MAEQIKISELAARAGVEKSTVQHYIREGLIPTPRHRPHRNMHYYDADLVERIKLIRELQAHRNLPLAKIKQVLDDDSMADERGIEQIRAYLYATPEPLDLMHARPVTRAKLVEDTGIEPETLDRLQARGLVSSRRRGSSVVYDPIDAAIVHACQSMRHAGLGEQNGFRVEDLDIYLAAMRDLIAKEMKLFARVLHHRSREEIVEMARRGLEGTNTLLLNLRRKLLLQVLGDASAGLRRGKRAARRTG